MAVLLDRVHAWLLTEIDEHLREITPSFLLLLRLSGFGEPGIGNGSERLEALRISDRPRGSTNHEIRQDDQLPGDVPREQQAAVGCSNVEA
jgi:hypothetical protein